MLGAGLASAALLAACGSGGAAPAAKPQQSGSAELLASSYQKLQDARSADMTLAETVRTANGTEALSLSASGAFHWSQLYGSMDMKIDVPSSGASLTMKEILSGPDEYVSVPSTRAGAPRWIEISLSQFEAAGSSQGMNPSQTLQLLQERAVSLTDLGPATIDGVATTHYRAELSLTSGVKPSLRTFMADYERLSGAKTIPVDIWIDGGGLPRRVEIAETLKHSPVASAAAAAAFPLHVTVTMDFSHYGVEVAAPTVPTSGVERLPASVLSRFFGGA